MCGTHVLYLVPKTYITVTLVLARVLEFYAMAAGNIMGLEIFKSSGLSRLLAMPGVPGGQATTHTY